MLFMINMVFPIFRQRGSKDASERLHLKCVRWESWKNHSIQGFLGRQVISLVSSGSRMHISRIIKRR